MPQISRETTERVLAATDIVELIGSYIEVKRAGTSFKALCPFHNEKTASFTINAAKQFYYCHGCKASGDAIKFIREYKNLPFTDAVKELAAKAGIAVQEEVVDPKEDFARRQRGRLLDINREAAAFMHRLLMKSKEEAKHARDYLKSRGFSAETAVRWTMGWAPASTDTFRQWAREKGYTGRELLDAGLLRNGDRGAYPLFRDRLMIPIRNDHGDVVGFTGRHLREGQGGGKYVNTSETVLFKKSSILFGLDRARRAILKEGAVLICEGQLDAVSCHEHGIENAIASQGTAFTPLHAQLLRRYGKNAILCYDSDSAGFGGAEKAFRNLAPESIGVRMMRLPAGEDPDSFLRKNGTEAFRELMKAAPDFFDALIDRDQQQGKLDTPESRAIAMRDYAPLLSLIVDPGMRDALVNKVTTRLRVGATELRGAVSRAGRAAAQKPAPRDRGEPAEEAAATEILPAPLDPSVGYLCSLALHSSSAQEWLGEQFETLHEAADFLEGIPLLEAILAARPDAASPASVNAFLSTLREDQRLALYGDPTFHQAPPANPHEAAETALARLSAKCLLLRDARIKADLSRPDLTVEQMASLLEQAKEVKELLTGLDQRFVFDDRLAPSSKKKKSFENSKFPQRKRERNS